MSEEAELLVEITGGIALVTLNRPKALNSLSEGMVRQFGGLLHDWAADPAIRAVVVKGAGEKAFCAGGDIRQLYDAKATGEVPTDFFYDEYVMNSRIHHFPKPYIALLNGITMGGGFGISAHGRYRVATEKTLWAMPETAIGLFPDVGGSYVLPRLPGKLGLYLGLTGARLKAADLCAVGLATHYMPVAQMDAFVTALMAGGDVEAELARFSGDPGPSPITPQLADIDRLFAGPTLEQILVDLAADASDWAKATTATLLKMSPTSLKLTLAASTRSAGLSFDEVMRMEFRVVSRLMKGRDFFEGVRALLVDRDNAPNWSPSGVAQVSDADIDAYFQPLAKELELG